VSELESLDIKDGICCVCGVNVEQEREYYPVHVCLAKLPVPRKCEMDWDMEECSDMAIWGTGRETLTATCDKCIIAELESLPDNRMALEPALADIKERHLKEGSRVRIQYGDETGNLGTVYNIAWGRPALYHVRPDGWPEDVPGIAYKAEELDILL